MNYFARGNDLTDFMEKLLAQRGYAESDYGFQTLAGRKVVRDVTQGWVGSGFSFGCTFSWHLRRSTLKGCRVQSLELPEP